jgi:hypothetical protein
MLQWLRANGCPWDARVYEYAAQDGHEAMLQWARANGCPEWPGRETPRSNADYIEDEEFLD